MPTAAPEPRHQNLGLLLRLIHKFAPEDLPEMRAPQWDWRAFAAFCDRHQLASIVYCRLRNLGSDQVPVALMEHLRCRFFEISARNYDLAQKVVELTAAFEEERIPVVAYKGAAVAKLAYGDLALRQFQDVDLLVRQTDVLRAVTLLQRRGFEPQRQDRWWLCRPEKPRHLKRAEEIPFRAPSQTYFVDLHWSLGPDYWRAFYPDIDGMWDRIERITLLQGSACTLCPEDLLLALCSHGAKHRWQQLKWLVDVTQLLERPEMNWSRVEEMVAHRPGAGVCAGLAVSLAKELLDAQIPADAVRILRTNERTRAVASAIRDEILWSGESTGDYYGTLLALQEQRLGRMRIRATTALRYPGGVFRETLVQVTHKERALIDLPEHFQFLYHVIRPIRLMAKYGRRAARMFT